MKGYGDYVDTTPEENPERMNDKYFEKNDYGSYFAHTATIEELQEMNKRLSKQPEDLKEIYTKKSLQMKNVPAYFYSVEKLKVMNEALLDYPETIAKIYTTKNIKENLPAHIYNTEQLKAMNDTLMYSGNADLIEKIYTSKNKDGKIPADGKDTDYILEMQRALDIVKEQ